jgi:hypothetical protein
MPRPKHNPLPESEQSKQRSRRAADRLREAGGKNVTVRLPDKEAVAQLARVREALKTESDNDAFLELLRLFDAKLS